MKYISRFILVFICLTAFISCSGPSRNGPPRVAIQTVYGDITIELYPAQAPKTVAAFLSYMDAGYYKNSSFYRVLNEDNQPTGSAEAALIQGGVWKKVPAVKDVPGIPHETTAQTKLLHKDGTVSLARQAPGTGSTEFFICIGDQPGFDYGGSNNGDGQGYAAFGRVIKGMDIVRKIQLRPSKGELFDPEIEIINAERL